MEDKWKIICQVGETKEREVGMALTLVPERFPQGLVAEGLVLRDILGGGVLPDLSIVVLGVAAEGV